MRIIPLAVLLLIEQSASFKLSQRNVRKDISCLFVARNVEKTISYLDNFDDKDDGSDDSEEDFGEIGDMNIRFINEDDYDAEAGEYDDDEDEEFSGDDEYDEGDGVLQQISTPSPGRLRWAALNPKLKARLIKQGQARAIAKKKKHEPHMDKKRRIMMHVKKSQQARMRASKIKRPLTFRERTPLAALFPGMELTGKVISLTDFGAYVDVGTERDGLLHISQMTRDYFVQHPLQFVSPGDEITVTVRSASSELKKLQLTMLPKSILDEEAEEEDNDEPPLQLNDIEVDDELWGELKRITDYGAYVNVGAEVDAFLHFMDHPSWNGCEHPSEIMNRGDRVRIWVSDIDKKKRRIKLTANRPRHLPGPRLEAR